MRIAILGTRGIPANYGGFETFAEELSPRLAARGHDVTVYCRSHHVSKELKEYKGVRLVVLPTIRQKYLASVFLKIMIYMAPSRAHEEGRTRRHGRWCGMRWTRRARETKRVRCVRRNRVVLIPRRWDQVSWTLIHEATVANKPGHRGGRV